MNRSVLTQACLKALTLVLMFSALLAAFPLMAAGAAEETVVITLDPGHGGKKSDDGSTGIGATTAEQYGGVNEYFYTLSISEYCMERLLQYQNVEVYLTRDNNEDCPGLKERAEIAASHDSDALISIHNNSATNTSAKGAEVIVPNANYDADIGADSTECANLILNRMVEDTGVTKRRIYTKDSTSVKYPDSSVADHFQVIRNGKLLGTPVVMIVECAFLSNQEDYENHFATEDGLKAMGYAIADGLAEYYELSLIPEVSLVHVSNDELSYLGEDGNQIGQAFEPGKYDGWDKVIEIEQGAVSALRDWGWATFHADSFEFGYMINGTELFSDEFTHEAEQPVIEAAAALGGSVVSRFQGKLDASILNLGENTVQFCIRLNDGALTEVLREYTVIVMEPVTEAPTEPPTEAPTEAPTELPTEAPTKEPAATTDPSDADSGCTSALPAAGLLIVSIGALWAMRKKED